MDINNISFSSAARLGMKYWRYLPPVSADILRKRFRGCEEKASYPRLVVVFITNKCNLSCPMCLNARNRASAQDCADVSLETFRQLLPEFKRNRPFVYFTGGEPLMASSWFEIISMLSSNGIFTALMTNGFLLKKYAREIIDSGVEFLSVSLGHHDPVKHDASRGQAGSFKMLMEGLEAIKNERGKTPSNIKIATAINLQNYDALGDMFDLVKTLGVDEWSIQDNHFVTPEAKAAIDDYYERTGVGAYFDGSVLDRSQYLTIEEAGVLERNLETVMSKAKKHSMKCSVKPELSDIQAYYTGATPSRASTCDIPYRYVNILNSSKVMSCLGVELGDLCETPSLETIWKSEKATDHLSWLRKQGLLPGCYRCGALNYSFPKEPI